MTADTMNTLTRLFKLHGRACAKSAKAADRFRLTSSWHHERRATRLAAAHHHILVAMLSHEELTEVLLRMVS